MVGLYRSTCPFFFGWYEFVVIFCISSIVHSVANNFLVNCTPSSIRTWAVMLWGLLVFKENDFYDRWKSPARSHCCCVLRVTISHAEHAKVCIHRSWKRLEYGDSDECKWTTCGINCNCLFDFRDVPLHVHSLQSLTFVYILLETYEQ